MIHELKCEKKKQFFCCENERGSDGNDSFLLKWVFWDVWQENT